MQTPRSEPRGLGGRGGEQLQNLSHGNRQRVQLAAALLHSLAVLVLDESFSGLAPVAVDVMSALLREQADAGVSVIFSSHSAASAEVLFGPSHGQRQPRFEGNGRGSGGHGRLANVRTPRPGRSSRVRRGTVRPRVPTHTLSPCFGRERRWGPAFPARPMNASPRRASRGSRTKASSTRSSDFPNASTRCNGEPRPGSPPATSPSASPVLTARAMPAARGRRSFPLIPFPGSYRRSNGAGWSGHSFNGRALRYGVVPAGLVYSSAGYLRDLVGARPPRSDYCHLAGIDVVRVSGEFLALEDNVRVPSGIAYALMSREATVAVAPGWLTANPVRSIDGYAARLRRMLQRIAPRQWDASLVVLTPGRYNAAYFEHQLLAEAIGGTLVEGRDLIVQEDEVWRQTPGGGHELVDVIYSRVNAEWLDPLVFRSDSLLGARA